MKLTTILVLCVSICSIVPKLSADEDLGDFSFDNFNSTNEEEYTDLGNYVDESEDEVEQFADFDEDLQASSSPLISMKEMIVKRHLLESMQSKDMKHQVARVLPILRVMTPEQKLALATLITTQVVAPKEQQLTLDQVSAIFGNNPNTTEDLMLPISLDIANMFSRRRGRDLELEKFLNSTLSNETNSTDQNEADSTTEMPEELPSAEQLRSVKRPPKRRIGGSYRPFTPPLPPRFRPGASKPNKPSIIKMDHTNCEMFGPNICLRAKEYPHDSIMASIRRNKQAIHYLIADYRNSPESDPSTNFIDNSENRRGGPDGGYMCQSDVKFARPQGARSTKGKWKFIVNVGGDHTQTLRLERCDRPNGPCSYLNDNYSSRCVQLYNYHRLLAWDQNQGLHMDIFKVPSCCSCHIDNYKVAYPPHHPTNHVTSPEEDFPEDSVEHNDHHRAHHVEDHQVIHHHFHGPGDHVEHVTVTIPTNHQGAHQYEIYKLDHPINPRLETQENVIKPPSKRPNYNQHFKRSNGQVAKGPNPGRRNPPQQNRRRTPPKINRDLAPSESTYLATPARDRQGVVSPTAHPTAPSEGLGAGTLPPPRRVNYNYHPIIDFFETERVQERADFLTSLGDSDWRPVTAYGLTQQQPQQNERY